MAGPPYRTADPVSRLWLPEDNSLAAMNFDPIVAGQGVAVVNGTLYLMALRLLRNATITKIYWTVTTGAITPVAGQNEVCLYDSNGVRLGTTNVDADTTSTGVKTTTISLSQSLIAKALYWVGLLFNAATPPNILRGTGAGQSFRTVNVNLTAALSRMGIGGTGLTASPSSITPSSIDNGTSTLALWAGVGT
jgi:hypothetical protein